MAHPSNAAKRQLSIPIFVKLSLAIALACLAVACGGDSSSASPSAPSAPSPSSTTATTATSVNVTVSTPIRMGQTAQASGTAALSNGQSQNVTTGWRSDVLGVATVTDAGLVTGVGNGQANIYVITGGRQGQQVIRVVPDYHGEWEGTLRVTSCTQTGVFTELGLCNELPANSTEGFDLSLTQTGEALSVLMYLGDGSQSVPAPIAGDGSSAFAGRTSYTEEGVTLTLDSAWQINSTRVGALSGTVNDVYRFTGYPGEGRVVYDIQSATRSATSVRAQNDRGQRSHGVHGLGRRLRSMR